MADLLTDLSAQLLGMLLLRLPVLEADLPLARDGPAHLEVRVLIRCPDLQTFLQERGYLLGIPLADVGGGLTGLGLGCFVNNEKSHLIYVNELITPGWAIVRFTYITRTKRFIAESREVL
ncbi:hypothetical protein [Deinococcus alpinitundrae]|uniref:hypothetical protein n=1 Tax=Deinococcus alpinitundrae TaxID=468913 RepID=UPI00137B8819|nr:hypothetical protein [Deinococcus alpinitundrae]